MTRTIKIILTVSVLLNVLLAGMVSSYAYKAKKFRPEWRESVREELSLEGQAYMKETFKKVRQDMKGAFEKNRGLRQDMLAVMEADTFDSARYDDLAAKMMEAHTEMMEAKMKTHRQLAQDLPPEDRKLLARKLSDVVGMKEKPRHSRKSFGPNREASPPESTDRTSP